MTYRSCIVLSRHAIESFILLENIVYLISRNKSNPKISKKKNFSKNNLYKMFIAWFRAVCPKILKSSVKLGKLKITILKNNKTT